MTQHLRVLISAAKEVIQVHGVPRMLLFVSHVIVVAVVIK